METLQSLAGGFAVALAPVNLGLAFLGVLVGNAVGVLPGIGPIAVIAMLLPITYGMPPTAALMMLAGLHYGARYGGATTSILLNVPGVASAAVTCLDGHALARRGRAGAALLVAMLASFAGACFGILLMILAAPLLVELALTMGPAEYFAAMLLGLVAAAGLARGSPLEGVAMVVIGLVLGTVGSDVDTGVVRFAFGLPELADGLSIVAIAMGLFGVRDCLRNANRIPGTGRILEVPSLRGERQDLRRATSATLRASAVGAFFGVLPGTGPAIAAFVAYAVEKAVSRTPERFGRGAIEGVAAPEAANDAAAQAAFVPTLALGIPGDAVMAILLGAMILYGIQPGPRLVTERPDVFWGLVASFWVGNALLLVLNLPLIGLWVRLLRVPYRPIFPVMLLFVCVGALSVRGAPMDVLAVLAFGVLGQLLARLGFEPAPLLLGFVLGPLLEEHFRRALLPARGDLARFLHRPVAAVLLAAAVLVLVLALAARLRPGRASASAG